LTGCSDIEGVAGFEEGAELCRLLAVDAAVVFVVVVVVVVGTDLLLIAALVMRQ